MQDTEEECICVGLFEVGSFKMLVPSRTVEQGALLRSLFLHFVVQRLAVIYPSFGYITES